MDAGRVIRAGPPGRDGRADVERRQCAALGVEAKRGHRGIELIGDKHQRQRWVEGNVARTRAGAHHGVASLDVAQRFSFEVEPVDEHAVGAEVCGEREAVGGVGNDTVRMRRILPLSIRSAARVLHHVRR